LSLKNKPYEIKSMIKKKLKIGIFTDSFLPYVSGVVVSILNFKEGLERLGHQVFIFTQKFPNYKEKEKNVFRFKSITIKANKNIEFPLPLTISPKIHKKIKRLNLDIIHIQHPFLMGMAGLYYSKKLKIPCIFTYHTRYEECAPYYLPILPKKISSKLAKKITFNFAKRCDAIIVPSIFIKKYFQREGIKKPLWVLPTAIQFEKIKNAKKKDKLALPKKARVLLYVGRLAREKNVVFLLKAFKKVLQVSKNKNVYLLLVGDGPATDELKKLSKKLDIERNVIFFGKVNPKEVPQYYKAADVFVFASKTDTQALVLPEAMAAGIPIVALNFPGPKDIITNGVNGFLTKDSLKEFSQKIRGLLDDEKKRKKIALNGQKTAKKYSIPVISKKLVVIYQKTIEDYQRKR